MLAFARPQPRIIHQKTAPTALALLCAIITLAGPVQAAAQTTEKPVQISLPAGNLADALERLGDQSGVQIMYEPALAKGVKVAAVSGTLTVTDTLRQLLARTGLQADRVNDKTVVLKRAEAKKNPIKKQDQTTLEQTPQESPLAEVDVVVVTAQKKTENLMEVPVPVSTVAGQTLLDNSELRVQDFYSTLPGVRRSLVWLSSPTAEADMAKASRAVRPIRKASVSSSSLSGSSMTSALGTSSSPE